MNDEELRGRHGRVRQRPKQEGHPLPSIVLANAQSPHNKVNILQSDVNFLLEIITACVVAIREMWLAAGSTTLHVNKWLLQTIMTEAPIVTGKIIGVGLFVNKNC